MYTTHRQQNKIKEAITLWEGHEEFVLAFCENGCKAIPEEKDALSAAELKKVDFMEKLIAGTEKALHELDASKFPVPNPVLRITAASSS